MRLPSYVDLAGDRRRDERRAVLLQALDGGLDLGDHGVDLGGLAVKETDDHGLLIDAGNEQRESRLVPLT